MKIIITPLGSLGLFAILYLGILFANLSRRLGDITKMAAHYRWFSVANAFIAIAALSQMMRGGAVLTPNQSPPLLLSSWFALLTFHIPLALGVTIDLVLVWHYWGWILKEKIE